MKVTVNKLELASELAHYMLVQEWEDRPENIFKEDDNGDTRYNEEAQDIFNHYYDVFEIIIENVEDGWYIKAKGRTIKR